MTDSKLKLIPILRLSVLSLLLAGCGSRALSLHDDGGAPVDARVLADSTQPPDAQRPPDGPRPLDGSSCKLPSGTCRTTTDCADGWRCVPNPGTCQLDPCGCSGRPLITDGSTAKRCVAQCLGYCVPPDTTTTCHDNSACAAEDYCHFPVGNCGRDGRLGTCQPRVSCGGAGASDEDRFVPPDAGGAPVPPEEPPGVCGCDGTTYADTCVATLAGVSLSHDGPCLPADDPLCQGVECGLVNDCCSCQAIEGSGPFPGCPAICDTPRCLLWGISQPEAYCHRGQCLLGDGGRRCYSDNDCELVNDCCACAALPEPTALPDCMADCFVNSCTAIGLLAPQARCLQGTCRVVSN